MSLPTGAFMPGGVPDKSTNDAVATMKEIAAVAAAPITYAADEASMATPGMMATAKAFRFARVGCAKCGAKCEISQGQNVSDDVWRPDVAERLGVFGWQTDGERWFCGKWCGQMYGHQMREHGGKALPAVTRVNDQSYARRMYAEQTTPAAPPAPVVAATTNKRGK